ncbi:MAG: alpha-amylase family glycosyl hydrolase [Candidatus Roizmanbacteria bacterium]|nr:alpha-amylase family glycosyl hydrolase [Candidatus Roizmanbacteria bacterium]
MLNIKNDLETLYPTKPSLAEEIDELVEKNIQTIKHTRPFTAKDSALIVYPDHIYEVGKPSLESLTQFLDTNIQDTVNTIHLLPFHLSGGDGGFAVEDYDSIDPRFGTWNDIELLSKKYRIMADFVANHTAITHTWFKEFLNGNERYKDYYLWFEKPMDTSWAYRTRTNPLLTPFEKKDGSRIWVWTNFSPLQADLNYQNPEVFLAMTKILIGYLTHRISLLRIDAAGYLWKQVGTPSVHMKQTHTILAIWREIMAQINPEAYLITETNVPNNINVQYFGKTVPEAHMVYNFGLSPLLLHTFMKKDSTLLTNWVQTLHTPRDDTTYFTITQTHDGVNVRSIEGVLTVDDIAKLAQCSIEVGGGINSRLLPNGTTEPYELNVVYKSFLGSNEALLATQAISLCIEGVPGIYFNSMIGAKNWEEGVKKSNEKRSINRRKYTLNEINAFLQTEESCLQEYKHMVTVRSQEELFAPKVPQKILSVGPKVFGLQRISGKKALYALTNISDTLISIDVSTLFKNVHETTDLLTNRLYRLTLNPIVFLRPYQSVWLKTAN